MDILETLYSENPLDLINFIFENKDYNLPSELKIEFSKKYFSNLIINESIAQVVGSFSYSIWRKDLLFSKVFLEMNSDMLSDKYILMNYNLDFVKEISDICYGQNLEDYGSDKFYYDILFLNTKSDKEEKILRNYLQRIFTRHHSCEGKEYYPLKVYPFYSNEKYIDRLNYLKEWFPNIKFKIEFDYNDGWRNNLHTNENGIYHQTEIWLDFILTNIKSNNLLPDYNDLDGYMVFNKFYHSQLKDNNLKIIKDRVDTLTKNNNYQKYRDLLLGFSKFIIFEEKNYQSFKNINPELKEILKTLDYIVINRVVVNTYSLAKLYTNSKDTPLVGYNKEQIEYQLFENMSVIESILNSNIFSNKSNNAISSVEIFLNFYKKENLIFSDELISTIISSFPNAFKDIMNINKNNIKFNVSHLLNVHKHSSQTIKKNVYENINYLLKNDLVNDRKEILNVFKEEYTKKTNNNTNSVTKKLGII